jgi:hypothetical protein
MNDEMERASKEAAVLNRCDIAACSWADRGKRRKTSD